MTDQTPDYDELLERGRELSEATRDERNALIDAVTWAYRMNEGERRHFALALLDRHLAQRVRELQIVPLDQCPQCGALQDRGTVMRELAASDDEEEARLRVREAEAENDRPADA